MREDFVFHHIGYATKSIAETSVMYLNAGYKATETYADTLQGTNICIISKEGMPTIELVEPINEKSSVNKLLKNNRGICPYHVCYEVDDIEEAFVYMTEKLNYIPLFRPVEAVAFNNRLICYLFHSAVGFVELLNKK